MSLTDDIGKLSDAQRKQLLDALTRSRERGDASVIEAPNEDDWVANKQVVAEDNKTQANTAPTPLDVFENLFRREEEYVQASFDRKCLRQFLDDQAQRASAARQREFADLHKWWDGTGYAIYQEWLFTDEMTITIELINKDGSKKDFKLQVSI